MCLTLQHESCEWYVIVRNHNHERYKLYATRCDFHRDFTMPNPEWNLYASQTEWGITCIFHGYGFLFLYQRCCYIPLLSPEMSKLSSRSFWKCCICGIKYRCRRVLSFFGNITFSHPSTYSWIDGIAILLLQFWTCCTWWVFFSIALVMYLYGRIKSTFEWIRQVKAFNTPISLNKWSTPFFTRCSHV